MRAASEKVRAAPPGGHPCDAVGVRLVKPVLGAAARGGAFSDRVGSIGRISTGFVKLCSTVVKRAPVLSACDVHPASLEVKPKDAVVLVVVPDGPPIMLSTRLDSNTSSERWH